MNKYPLPLHIFGFFAAGIGILFAVGLLFVSIVTVVRSITDPPSASVSDSIPASDATHTPAVIHTRLTSTLSDLKYHYDSSASLGEVLDVHDSDIMDYLISRYGQTGTTEDSYRYIILRETPVDQGG